MPFELPQGWVWTTLGVVGEWQSGGTPSRSNKSYYGGNIPWLKTGDLNDGFILNIPESITEEAVANSSAKINPTGSVLIAMYGATIGKLGILTFPSATNQACCACIEFRAITQLYLFYFLLSQRSRFISRGGGGTQSNISKELIVNTYIPLPPLSEQQRIVIEIEKYFVLIDDIEQGKADLQSAIKQAKSKILELAISGKLVPQNPADEPASELLKRINPKAEIACDNEHNRKFPDGWAVLKVKDAFIINPRNELDDNMDVGFIPMAYINDGYSGEFKYAQKKWAEIKNGFTHFSDGDIAVAKISPCLENLKSMILKDLPNGVGAGTTELYVFRALYTSSEYSLYFFKSNIFVRKCVGTFNGVVGQQRVGKRIIEDILFPIPPSVEQERIVAKIKELFLFLDEIQESLEA